MNKIILIGRLTKDPETKIIDENGRAMTKFTLAVNRSFKNAEGEIEADFIPVVFWGRKAEIISKYMKKGRLISISGRVQTRNYDDATGIKRYVTEVVADDFQFVDYNKEESVI